MDRRNFIKSSCGLCAAIGSGFLLTSILQSCATSLGVVKTSADNNNLVKIPLSGFDQSSTKIVRVNNYNYDLAVLKHTDGTYHAMVLMCTHAGQPLTKTGDTYYCTLHGSQFDKDGNVLKGPAEKTLIHLPVRTENDNLLITLVR